VLCAFDLLEADGEDLRRLPIEIRKAGLVQLLRTPSPGIALNQHYVGDGDIVYRHVDYAATWRINIRTGGRHRSAKGRSGFKASPARPAGADSPAC